MEETNNEGYLDSKNHLWVVIRRDLSGQSQRRLTLPPSDAHLRLPHTVPQALDGNKLSPLVKL